MISLKKLNNKGLTAVEILVCFVLMVILTVSMYSTVISYKNKQNIESDRDKIVAYKNLLTKEIQDDLIKKGLIDAKLAEEISNDGNNTDKYYKVEFTFRDGTKKTLEVTAQYARDFETCSGTLTAEEEGACKYDKDDVLKVSYGSAPGADDYTSYVLPDLGYGYNGNIYASEYGNQCSGNYDENGVELDDADKQGCKVYDFRINNVIVSTDENIFSFYVGFYHPDLDTRYGIDIVCPINFDINGLPEQDNVSDDPVYERLVSLVFRDNPSIKNSASLNKSASSASENGLFSSTRTNSGNATYYFRGNVNNNYVVFAGLLWRIVRINEDNSIRMILDEPINGGELNLFAPFGTTYDKMYYSNSDIKNKLLQWYNKTLSSYESWLENEQYCESFNVYHAPDGTSGDMYTAGSVTPKKYMDYNVTFKCQNDGNGYGVINGKIGLLSYDEAVFAGAYPWEKNSNSYLDSYFAGAFWLMGPGGIRDTELEDYPSDKYPIVHLWYHVDGSLKNGFIYNSRASIRPVINLKADVKALNISNGTYTNPYVVKL